MSDFLLGMDSIAFTIFGIEVAWYGIIVTSGIVCAFLLFLFLAKKKGLDDDFCLEVFLWVVILAILFARIFYVFPRIGKEYHTFKQMINIREGGLTIVGGIFGGALGALICVLRNKKYHLADVTDCIVLPLLLGQIIGRWGNYVNQELFGLPITNPSLQWFPFAVYIDMPQLHYAGTTPGWYCALFFYEGFINFIGLSIALIFLFKYKNKIKSGVITLGYLAWYGIVRFLLEFLKIDHETIGNTKIGSIQAICFLMFIASTIVLGFVAAGKIKLTSDKFQKIIDNKLEKLKEQENKNASNDANSITILNDDNNIDTESKDSPNEEHEEIKD